MGAGELPGHSEVASLPGSSDPSTSIPMGQVPHPMGAHRKGAYGRSAVLPDKWASAPVEAWMPRPQLETHVSHTLWSDPMNDEGVQGKPPAQEQLSNPVLESVAFSDPGPLSLLPWPARPAQQLSCQWAIQAWHNH
jgi:hypothetical protein